MKSCFLLALLSLAAAEPALIPVGYFKQASTYSLASLAPDAKHVAVAVSMDRDGVSLPTLTGIFSAGIESRRHIHPAC